jgi:adenosylhomocysteine nucleosidase
VRFRLPAGRYTVWAGREIAYAHGPGPIVLANSGVGIANAAATTQFLIDRYRPTGIVFCGIASAVNPAHHIGDLVIPESYVTFDYGYWGDQGMITDSVTVGRTDSAGFDRMLEMPVNRELYEQLGQAANSAAYLLRSIGRRLPEIHQGGVAISGNAFLDNKAKRDHLYKQLKAQITDTESAGVVQTAHAAGVPVVVMRACAAPAGESTSATAQADLVDFFQVSAHNVALVLRQLLTP